MRILDHLAPIEDTDLDAFITRLDDAPSKVRENLKRFIVSDKVRDDLGLMLEVVGQRLNDGRDVGRFIYGSFGSGKSHLMTVLGKMLERDEAVYDLGHEHLRALRADNPWLDTHKTLVVRLNMMGKRDLSSALYEAFNKALPDDVPELDFTNESELFDLIERDAERLGGLDALLDQLVADRAIPKASFYHRMRDGDLKQRLSLAARLQKWRDHGKQSVRSEDFWIDLRDGLDRMARHAQDHGFTAITWLIDEMVIWIREKDRATYIKQINDLSSMVDHDAARVLPFFVVLAVQMDISETCPEDLSEKDFREQLGFVSDRFKPFLYLEEQDLVEVAAQRVLARREGLEPKTLRRFEKEIDRALKRNQQAVRELSGELDIDHVRKLYPFHPALLRVLIDVTQALSRQRTAVAALYGLLAQYPDLKVGDFVPLGALWDIIFAPHHVQSLRQNRKSTLSQQLADAADTYTRLQGKIDRVVEDNDSVHPGDDEALARAQNELHQLVRSTLLCQLSQRPYFPDGRALRERVMASTLLRLNQTDVRARTERTGISKVTSLFRRLSGVAPQVQVLGDIKDPTIHIKIEQVDIERVLAAARSEVKHADRFAYMRKLLVDQLGLDLGTRNEGTHTVTWRGTRRKGKVRMANVRTLAYAGRNNEFDAGDDAFLILVDYPFDEDPGKGREDDKDTITRARKRSTHWTLAWLPEHLNKTELEALNNAAAVELIRKHKRRFLADYSARDQGEVSRALELYQMGRRTELEDAIRRVYFDNAQVWALKAALDGYSLVGVDRGRSLDKLSEYVLDRRYPNHPNFARVASAKKLQNVADWVIKATMTGQPVDLRQAHMSDVDAFIEPLELAYKGQNTITPRSDGRYLRQIHAWTRDKTAFSAHELRDLLMADDGWQFGMTAEVADFFIYYLLMAEGYEAKEGGEGLTIHDITALPKRFEMVKDQVVDASTWDQARLVAKELLGLQVLDELPSSPAQSKLNRAIQERAKLHVSALKQLETLLNDVCTWANVSPLDSKRIDEAQGLRRAIEGLCVHLNLNAERIRKLAELKEVEGFEVWQALLSKLADETSKAKMLEGERLAFEQVNTHGTSDERDEVVLRLQNLLRDSFATQQLSAKVPGWSENARRCAHAILKRLKKTQPDPPPITPPPSARRHTQTLDRVAHADVLNQTKQALRELLRVLESGKGDHFHITITLEKAQENTP